MENLHRSPIWVGNLTHCKWGHEFTPENTYVTRQGPNGETIKRNCRACMAERTRAWKRKKALGLS